MNKHTTSILFTATKYCLCLLVLLFVMSDSLQQEQAQTIGSQKMSKEERIDKAFELEYFKTRDPQTGDVPKERLFKAKAYTQQLLAEKDAIPGIVWEERGPDNVGGRTRAILYDASDPTHKTVWAAGVAGGLWKTTNFSAAVPTWNNIDDFFDNLAITSIIQDPTNSNIMYFGTGEGWFNGDAVRGLGIWKTTDGGNNWSQLTSTNNSGFYYVLDLIIDKYGNLYATTRDGLKRSENGGTSWTTVINNNRFADLELGADGDVYATEGTNFSVGKVWKSDDATHGSNLGKSGNWVEITPSGSFQRIELSTAPSDANRVYILCQGNGSNDVTDIYRSDNASGNSGISWTSLPVPTIINQGNGGIFTNTQAWYNLISAVDPNNEDIVYIGGIDALRSTDAGANWTQVSVWSPYDVATTTYTNTQNVHADHHMIVFEPGSSSKAIWGTDGGLYYTQDANNASNFPSWVTKNKGYNVTQFYACATSNEVGATNFMAGAQDNGTQRYTSSGINSTTKLRGGDGGYCHIDEDDPNLQILSVQFNGFSITNNAWGSKTDKKLPKGTFTSVSDYDSKFNILYVSSTGGEYGRIKEVGTNNVVDAVVLNDINDQISAITVSPNIDHRIYIGLINARVIRVDNADGASPSSSIITPTGAAGYCSSIAIEKGNENHLLVSYSNYGVTSIFESTNGGTTWNSVEGNLPDMPVRWVIFNPNNSDQALIATEMGVWSTDDLDGGSTDWDPTNSMLANTRVDMLQVRPADNVILAATHGRGLFTTDDLATATVSFVNSTQTVNETSSNISCPDYTDVNVPIQTLAAALSANVNIDVTIEAASTATEGQDFDVLTDPFTFTTGGGNTQNIVVRIYDDGSVEGDETIVLSINVTNSGASGASNGSLTQTTITIEDNDALPTGSTELTQIIGTRSVYTLTPFEGEYEDEKMQYIILASELQNAGFTAGNITELALDVIEKNSTIPFLDFTIKLGATTQNSLFNFINNVPFTVVYSDDYSTTAGGNPNWNNFIFSAPYLWDGTSNVLVEMCFNNTSTSDRDRITGYSGSGVYKRENGSDGCNISNASNSSSSKPYTRLKMTNFTLPESDLNASAEQSIGPNETVYFYSSTDGELMAKIENLSSHDYGCTTVSIDRAGSSSVNQLGNEVTDKTILITPASNNPSGSYNLTLYYTEAEISGYEATSNNGLTRNDLEMVKSSGAIADATSFESSSATFSTITSGDLAFEAAFSSGFSGFALAAGGGPTLVITDPTPVCAPNTVDITAPAITAGSDAGTLTYFTDAALTNPVGDPTMVGTGTYYIKLTDGSSKVSSGSVSVVVNPLPNLVITDPAMECAPSTVDLTDAAITAGSDAGTLTYFTDVGLTTAVPDETVVSTGTYYIKLTDGNGCVSSGAVNVTVNDTPDIASVGTQMNTCPTTSVELTSLTITDNNSVAGTTNTFHSAVPNSATDMSNQLASTEITSDQTIYIMVANTTTGCFDVESFMVEIMGCGNVCTGTDNVVLDFDGTNDRVELGNFSFYQDEFTIEGWINSTDNSGGAMVFSVKDGNNSGIGIERSGNSLRFVVRNPPSNAGGVFRIATTDVFDGNWHHFAAVKGSDDRLYLYIDGVLEGNTSGMIGDFGSNVYDIVLGYNVPASARYFDGQMDEIRLWNIAKTATEIQNNKDKELTGTESGLVAYYDFNQGTPDGDNTSETTLLDRTSNDNDGTLLNFTLNSGATSNYTTPGSFQTDFQLTFSNDSPSCAGETITFTASTGATNYEFFADADFDNEVDGGESLQDGAMNTYLASTLSDGDTIKVLATYAGACTDVAASVANINSISLASNVLDFDGINNPRDYIASSATGLPQVNATRTMEAWVKTTQTSIGNIISWGSNANQQRNSMAVRSGKLAYIGQFLDYTGSITINNDVWHHVAIVYDGTRFKSYVDGVLDIDAASNPNTNGQNLRIGKNVEGRNDEYFNGLMDEIRVWTIARTQAEIQASKDSELTGSESGLLVYYNFNEGTPDGNNTAITTVSDKTPNSFDGTLTDFARTGTTSNFTAPSPISGGGGGITLSNDSPACASETITFTATSGLANYEFFADADMDGEIDAGESLQNSASNTYMTNSLIDGDVISVIASSAEGCTTAAATSIASVDAFILQLSDNALDFDGFNDFVSTTATGLPQGAAARTMEAWVKTTQTNIGNIISWGTRANAKRNALAVRHGKLAFIGEFYDFKGAITINDGAWHHVAITYDGTNWKLFVDGVEDQKIKQFGNPFTSPPNTVGNNLRIGQVSQPSTGEFFNGTVDEVRIWNYARSSAQINASKDVELTGTETGLLVYYQFNQGTPDGSNPSETTLLDQTSNNFFGTLNNFALTGSTSNWTESRSSLAVGNVALSNNGPICPSESITFTATEGASNYEFFADADMDGEIDGGESLQNGASNTYTTAAFNDGDIMSVLATDVNGCTAVTTSTASISDFALQTGGNALDFDGANDYVNAGNILTASYTKEVWVNMDLNNNKNNNFISGGGNTGRHAFWAPQVYGYRVSAGHNNAWNLVQDPSSIQQGWQHYAVTYDATTKEMKLYRNGTLVSQRANVAAYTNGNQVLLGAYQNGNLFGGKMDEVRIWNYARTQAEIQTQKDVALTGSETGLIAYYDFNQGIPDGNNIGELVLQDRSQNSNNATLTNFGLTGGDNSNWTLSEAPIEVTNLEVSNNSPVCPGDDVTFMVTFGASNYEFFLDADADGEVDGGESLQSGLSNSYTTNTLDGGDVISVLVTDTKGCTDVLASVVTFNIDGCESTGFVATFRTTTPNESITIPTFSGEDYNYNVSWGDGGSNSGVIGDATHTYDVPGLYTVSIVDTFPRIYFNATGTSREKIQAIKQWGDIEWSNLEGAFDGCTNLIYDAVDTLDMTAVTSTARAFRNCTAFNGEINGWDVTAVLNMEGMFEGATTFNQPLDTWDVSNVLSMRNMFSGATAFNQSLGDWDLTGLNTNTSMLNMLTNCGMDTDTYDATLIGWEAQAVPNNMTLGAQGLKYCGARDARTRLKNDHNWVFVGDAIDEEVCGDLPFVTTWHTTNSKPSITIYTNSRYSYDYTIDWGDGTVESNLTGSKTHIYSDHSQPHTVSISGEFPHFVVGGVRRYTSSAALQLASIEQWGSIEWKDMEASFPNTTKAVYNATDQPDLSNVTSFYGAFYKSGLNGDFNQWEVSKVSDMSHALRQMKDFNSDLSRWDVSNVTRMPAMFYQSTSFNQSIGSWNLQSLVPNNFFSAGYMLDYTALSTANYDNTLIGWASQAANFPSNITVGASNLKYCAGEAARNQLIAKGWTFIGDSKSCSNLGSESEVIARSEEEVEDQEAVLLVMDASTKMVVYPNPAHETVTIAINSPTIEPTNLIIRDQLGRVIWSQQSISGASMIQIQLDKQQFPAGMYTVSLYLDQEIITEKLIVTRK